MFGMKPRELPPVKLAPMIYQHQKEMMIVCFIGGVAALGTLSLSVSLSALVWWSLNHDMKDIAIVIGFAGTVAGLVNTAIAYLMPSPLQQGQQTQRRQADAGPSGTPGDPISARVESKTGDATLPVEAQPAEHEEPAEDAADIGADEDVPAATEPASDAEQAAN